MNEPILLPYQIAWQNDDSRVRVAEKARRIGWSWGSAGEVALDAASASGSDVWYVGYNKDMAQEYVRDAASWATAFGLACANVEEGIFEDGEDRSILTFVLRFASGNRITALSSRPTNLRGKRGRVVIDEAAFHEDLPGLLKAALAVLIWGGKARVDVISTHNGSDNFFFTLCEEIRAGKRPYSLHRCTFDEAVSQGLFKRICRINGAEWSPELETSWVAQIYQQYGEDADEELRCIPARSGGIYLSRGVVEDSMKPGKVLRLEFDDRFVGQSESVRVGTVEQWCQENLLPEIERIPREFLTFFGEDFGRVSDRTVICPGYLKQDLVRRFPFSIELLNVPFDQQRQILFYLVDRLPRFEKGALDATGNGSYLAEVAAQRYGSERIAQVSLTERWYDDHLPPFRAALEDGLLELVRDADHLLDLQAIRVVGGRPRLPKTKTATAGKGPPRHGDAAIAYCLAYYASRVPIVQYDYEPAPTRKHNSDLWAGPTGLRGSRGGIL